MAKMSFEEWRLRKEYEAYLNEQETAEESKNNNLEAPAEPAAAEPAAAPEAPEEDYKAEMAEIRKEMAILAKALSPSLGDVQPVGIDDVVKKFFTD